MKLAAVSIVVLLGLAGCASQEPAAQPMQQAVQHEHPVEGAPWQLVMVGCQEAGGVAIYGREFYNQAGHHVPEPWVMADVSDEIGDPNIGTNGDPVTGDAVGHWHMATVCQSASLGNQSWQNFGHGWVGIMVEPPSWDVGGADLHFLLSGFSLPLHISETLPATNLSISQTGFAKIEQLAPGAFHVIHDDVAKGVYEEYGRVEDYRSVGDRVYRIWMTVPNGDAQIPVYFDWASTATAVQVTPEVTATGCHSRTPMHGPQGFLCGPSLLANYESFDRTITFHGRANATLEHAWDH